MKIREVLENRDQLFGQIISIEGWLLNMHSGNDNEPPLLVENPADLAQPEKSILIQTSDFFEEAERTNLSRLSPAHFIIQLQLYYGFWARDFESDAMPQFWIELTGCLSPSPNPEFAASISDWAFVLIKRKQRSAYFKPEEFNFNELTINGELSAVSVADFFADTARFLNRPVRLSGTLKITYPEQNIAFLLKSWKSELTGENSLLLDLNEIDPQRECFPSVITVSSAVDSVDHQETNILGIPQIDEKTGLIYLKQVQWFAEKQHHGVYCYNFMPTENF